jgi:hypothetical protein
MPEPAPEPTYGRLSRRWDLSSPITVSASGYVFDFHVDGGFTFTSEGLSPESLRAWAQHFAGRARRDLAYHAARIARNHAPHRAREFEAALCRELEARDWPYDQDGVRLTCRMHARVRLDDRVRDCLKPYWEKRMQMECDHENGVRRTELVDRLSQRWLIVLERLRDTPLAGPAARLTEQEFAEVIQQMIRDQKALPDRVAKLLEDLDTHANVESGLDEYQRAQVVDALARALRDPAPVPTPAPRGNGNAAAAAH